MLDPFIECAKELNMAELTPEKPHQFHLDYWDNFNKKIMPINNKLMGRSNCMVAILDGGHSIDDGVASEIGYYAGIQRGSPIFALRSDFRLCENVAGSINAQVYGYISMSGGGGLFNTISGLTEALIKYVADSRAWDKWLQEQ